jgi:hypothetical protein
MDTKQWSAPAGGHAEPARFLDAALRIGRRIAASARWEDGVCAWPEAGERFAATRATFYHGSAGIALFLAELAAATGDEVAGGVALGAVEHAIRAGEAFPHARVGLHDGRVGVAYAAARAGELLARPGLFARAEALIRPLAGQEAGDRALDVIGGAAGAIPALLRIAERVGGGLARGVARAMGDHLVRTALREPDGWSWATVPRGTSVRNLCGYAHGGSGFAHALLELYADTGNGAYRYAAEQALLYERTFFVPGKGNWHDLRVMEMVAAMHQGGVERLRERLSAGDAPPPWRPGFSVAWCHGAPGIARARLRAHELLGDPLYLEEARAAVAATRAALGGEPGFSLCHGVFGNAETLLHAARPLARPELARVAAGAALAAVRRFEDRGEPWPCGTGNRGTVPGLMLGEAGIGLFLLRLARPEVPSPLFITGPASSAADGGKGAAEYARARDDAVAQAVGRTLRRFRALGVDVDAAVPRREMGSAPGRSDLDTAVEALAACVAAEPGPGRRALLGDAFRVDRAAHALARAPADDSHAFLRELARPPADAVSWPEARLALAHDTRLVQTEWDWDGWMDAGDVEAPSGAPAEDEHDFLVQRRLGVVKVHPVTPFAARVLEALGGGASAGDVAASLAESAAADVEALRGPVVAQLRAAYERGLVELAPEPSPSLVAAQAPTAETMHA